MTSTASLAPRYALLIGVGADLPVTVDDAAGLHSILVDPQRCAYAPERVRLLTKEQATRQGILNGLDWLANQVQPDSDATVIVYFSGHGGDIPTYYLVPYGYASDDLAGTTVSGAEFTDKLQAIQTTKLLLLLDCCHAGGIGSIKARGFAKSPAPPELNTMLTRGSGRVMIASSRKDEYSYTGTPYSVFTQALREGLAGYGTAEQDGFAYVADIAMYVGRVVPQRTGDAQHPILKLAGADNFAVAYYAGGAKSPQPLPEAQRYLPPVTEIDTSLVERYVHLLKRYQSNLLAVEERMGQFIDQAAVPLDLERTKAGIVQKIAEIEAEIERQARRAGWEPPRADISLA